MDKRLIESGGHDVYDMRKVYSRDDLKRIGYKIEITDFDLRIPKNDEHDN